MDVRWVRINNYPKDTFTQWIRKIVPQIMSNLSTVSSSLPRVLKKFEAFFEL